MPIASASRKGAAQSSSPTAAGLDPGSELPPRLWGDEQIRSWLAARGLPSEIISTFEENLVNGLLCEDLSDGDLEGMGVSNPLHRKRVLIELARLFGRQPPTKSPKSPKRPRTPGSPNDRDIVGSDLGSTTDSKLDQITLDPESPSKTVEDSVSEGSPSAMRQRPLPSTGGTKCDRDGRPLSASPPKSSAPPIEREIQILLARKEGEEKEGEEKINVLVEQQGHKNDRDNAELKILVGRTPASAEVVDTTGSLARPVSQHGDLSSHVAVGAISPSSMEREELVREIRRLKLDLDLQKQCFEHLETLTKVRQEDLVSQNDQLSHDLKRQEMQLQLMNEKLKDHDEGQAEKAMSAGEAVAAAVVERETKAYSQIVAAVAEAPAEPLDGAADMQIAFERERQCLMKELEELDRRKQEQSTGLTKATARLAEHRATHEGKMSKFQATLASRTQELEAVRAQIRDAGQPRELAELAENHKQESQELRDRFKMVLQSTSEALTDKEKNAEPRSGMDELHLFMIQQMAQLEGDSTVWALSSTHAASWSKHERQNMLQEYERWQRRVEELEKTMVETVDHLTRVSDACDSRLQSQPQNDPSLQSSLQRWGIERQRLLEELSTCQNKATTLETRQRDLIMTVVEMQGIQGPGAMGWAVDSHGVSKERDSHQSQEHSREQSMELSPGQTPHDALASAKSRVAQLERRQETLQSTLSAVTVALQNRDAMESTWQQEKADLVGEINALRQHTEQLIPVT